MQLQHEQCLKHIETLQQQLQQTESQLADAKRGRQDDVDNDNADDDNDKEMIAPRATKLMRLTQLTQETSQLQAELDILKENDPQAVADLQHELQLVTQAAHRWTDNIFNCKTYLVKKRGMDRKQADKLLGISSEFDCKFWFIVWLCVYIYILQIVWIGSMDGVFLPFHLLCIVLTVCAHLAMLSSCFLSFSLSLSFSIHTDPEDKIPK